MLRFCSRARCLCCPATEVVISRKKVAQKSAAQSTTRAGQPQALPEHGFKMERGGATELKVGRRAKKLQENCKFTGK